MRFSNSPRRLLHSLTFVQACGERSKRLKHSVSQTAQLSNCLHQRSISAGAVVSEGATHEGLFYRPTVLTSVTPDMAAFTDEIFGPVAPITVFGSDEEAVALANASSYGLVASIYRSPAAVRAIMA